MLSGMSNIDAFVQSLIFGGDGGVGNMLHLPSYTTNASWSDTAYTVASGASRTFLDITGEGYLTFCIAWSSGAYVPNIVVTVDGVANTFAGGYVQYSTGLPQRLPFPIRFKTSLKIEATNTGTASLDLGVNYTYLVRNATALDESAQTVLSAGSRQYLALAVASTPQTIANITGSGYLMLLDGRGGNTGVRVSVTVDGVALITDRVIDMYEVTGNHKVSPFVGPIRFASSLVVTGAATDPALQRSIVAATVVLD